ncbi:L-arabinose transport system substrate-binding protein [Geodermatophilus tzadiensis]|uniref:L-arabinose transport system substrate-binding protein n=2 Tax=Geodermatophilus TaxID=1860 RepID=A0A2T0TU54_9ACTN|nr:MULTISPECIES: arabinose ABC transporter substrate-binding protein [Geodermatophilus]PRY49048.1 L-arabinose transport system substrate-binding protein [Geodermatophilus tzadiensis]SDD21738.1 L-arabinose transport system substrate-binding protein [Geodermatophilus telluris]
MLSSTRRRPLARASVVAGLALATVLSACSSGQEAGSGGGSGGGSDDGALRIAYIQKQGDQQYFVDQAQGAQEAADELGVELDVVDVGTDANKAISAIDTEVARGVDGIIIVVPDQQIGPTVAQAATNAGVPLLASDDSIEDGSGNAVPFVGFNGTQMGEAVGEEAARLFTESGWNAADTRVISAYKQDLSVCADRVQGARSTFEANGGGEVEVIDVGTDNSATGAQDEAGAVITANPGVKHWIVWGCNDENVDGVVTALQNSGVSPDDINGVGLGAYLACKPWAAGEATGMRSALFISGAEVGRTAVEEMVQALQDGEDLPAETFANTEIVTADNYEDAGVVCT